ncbi:uridine kinase [Cellulomonas sp.]|uniref:uridine kinase n=1 Tax=Cellulomonas sp. TaxID=40001 RepID=UPI0025BB0DD0|nr:uridine kinase [Cellulomonas sp.]
MPDSRRAMLDRVAAVVPAADALGRPVLVAVDGVDGAGKTTFADALGGALADRGAAVLRASVDGFHRPAAERYRRGRSSPEGFYRDSYDLEAFCSVLLDPLRAGDRGPRRVKTAVRDVRTDTDPGLPWRTVPHTTVLVVDGIFLQRAELADRWDVTVWLDVPFDVTYARMAVRDGCPPDPDDPANARYRQGQALYLAERDPAGRADVVLDNADPGRPRIVRGA